MTSFMFGNLCLEVVGVRPKGILSSRGPQIRSRVVRGGVKHSIVIEDAMQRAHRRPRNWASVVVTWLAK